MPKSPLKVVKIDDVNRDRLLTVLQEMQDDADKGRLTSLLYVKINDDGMWSVNWIGASFNRIKAIGGLEALKWELMASAEDA